MHTPDDISDHALPHLLIPRHSIGFHLSLERHAGHLISLLAVHLKPTKHVQPGQYCPLGHHDNPRESFPNLSQNGFLLQVRRVQQHSQYLPVLLQQIYGPSHAFHPQIHLPRFMGLDARRLGHLNLPRALLDSLLHGLLRHIP